MFSVAGASDENRDKARDKTGVTSRVRYWGSGFF